MVFLRPMTAIKTGRASSVQKSDIIEAPDFLRRGYAIFYPVATPNRTPFLSGDFPVTK